MKIAIKEEIENQIKEVKDKLFTEKSVINEFYQTKYKLLNLYLFNYILYQETLENKEETPMYQALLKITILLEKLLEVEEDLEAALKESTKEERPKTNIKIVDGTVKRPITDDIMVNEPLNKKKVLNNPRKKYKEKYEKMKNVKSKDFD
ncbi:Ubiquitin [Nosema bombycis CQ1]|uniref:Ubiquitin n=1 Tax=Nosema bombycis (strain CQ1 / CVCC 102059) TaxID=578461 RepID=R0KQZ8_NOSB1|nr:Ubiquitin [Nosema bombycis CQ1]|eukprot:EOB13161.1 Ubiquitin [Nosema bombycis CQ1]